MTPRRIGLILAFALAHQLALWTCFAPMDAYGWAVFDGETRPPTLVERAATAGYTVLTLPLGALPAWVASAPYGERFFATMPDSLKPWLWGVPPLLNSVLWGGIIERGVFHLRRRKSKGDNQ